MNTVTTKDVNALVARTPMAYDWFGAGWSVSNLPKDGPLEPIARFGIGNLGAVRTSRRAQGFGQLDFLQQEVFMGIPVWAVGLGVVFLVTGGLGLLGKK